ncbi:MULTISPECIES: PilW family protein [unclassified Variovorax]|jgi:type IV pilus assembly protein PilW|uniref:PilW family protein n=1 Tax=unclassified Variovorax TaxID=663243 RepID=UPI000F7EB515|nr:MULTISPECIES: PilW family protein [unclassified Variovorax]RSZ30153.1 prepilin-type N-terminal cleavage/methylation domain-containing protein [Variovorax sp. 553]RSZ30735.1 prepilin-type N-terminal cleavage/methylation domain-containing protein [Variovorax sp. 679]
MKRLRQQGVTLIELMVAVIIGLLVTLAVTSLLIFGESSKRSTTATNDMGQTGAYAAYVLDRAVRTAGSGFTQSWTLAGAFGCLLNATLPGTPSLPRSSAFPAPFATAFLGGASGSANLRVAPVLIGKSQSDAGSDVLVVMGGTAAAGDVPRLILSSGKSTSILRLDSTVGLAEGDLGLVSASGTTDCLLEQVHASTAFADSSGNDALPLGSTYYTASGASTSLSTLAASGSAYFTPLGNVSAGNTQFQMFGVGSNNTLYSYDLLMANGTDASQAVADGVSEMHALYGLDTNSDGVLDTWVDPGATGYDIATMMATPATARQVVAIRIALVLRSANPERANDNGELPSPASLTLFSDLSTSLQQTISFSTSEQHFRHRVVESTIPLRNVLLLPTS